MDTSIPGVVLLESGGWGGIAHYTYNLAQALAAAGCRLSLQTRSPYELAELPRDFELHEWPHDTTYSDATRATLGTVRAAGAGILHLQSTISARRDWLWLARLRRSGCRLVTTAHNLLPHDEAERNAFGMRWAFGRIYRTSDRIIVHGDDTRRQLLDTFRLPPGKVEVIPHGDYSFATGNQDRDAARAWLGLPDDAVLILCFGAIRDYKGIPFLIDAFAQLAGDFPHARLAIVGTPIRVDVTTYERRVEQHGIASQVILRPEYVPFADVGRYFAACDIAAYPYLHINQSGALQLAYGAARPVVATHVGEFPNTVRDGVNGLLVPPGDAAALAAALRDLLGRGGNALREMGRRSRELAETGHDWGDIARRTLSIYAALGSPR